MSTGSTRRVSSPARTPGLQRCTLSLLTLAMLASGAASLPALAAEPAQAPAQRMGDYRFSIAQQPLVAALNAFTSVTGWWIR